MLNIFRRHGIRCKRGYPASHRGKEKGDCTCPVHIEGRLGEQYIRTAANTRSLEKARRMVVDAEQRGTWEAPVEVAKAKPVEGVTVAQAVEEFMTTAEDPKGKHLARPTLIKYRTILNRLVAFTEDRGVLQLSAVTFSELEAFKRTWPTGPLATEHNITRLRTFFRWCIKHDWIKGNPAEALEMPPDLAVERLPYTDEEMEAILEAARTVKLDPQQPITNHELETFILVQRWAGLAISDTALLEKSEIRGDEIRLYRNKTQKRAKRVLVVVPLPPSVLARLKAMKLINGRYYFAHGSTRLESQVEAWRKRLGFVFRAARINNPGSHRFRHTFATDLLSRGVSIELVSRWLGHSNIKITQEHYSHYIESRIQAASNVLRGLYAEGDGRIHA